jgi:pimeloyl-ACP methyl ester carboxylesterase
MARSAGLFLSFGVAVMLPLAGLAAGGGGGGGNPAISTAAKTMNAKSRGLPGSGANEPGNQPSQAEMIVNLMRPERVAGADLAPDGRHLAYVAVDQYHVQIIIIDLDHIESPVRVEVGQGTWWEKATGKNWTAPNVTFLRWANPRRLVFAEGFSGIYAVNADGKGLTKLVADTDVAVVKGADLAVLAPTPPPGMAIQPNQFNLMPGAESDNMDPAERTTTASNTSTSLSALDMSMADPKSNSYINNGGTDRATDPTAVLGISDRMGLASEGLPRTPRVIAITPEDPEHIIVEASGIQSSLSGLYSYGLYRVDVETGARVSLGEAQLPGHQVLYDRAGHLRILLDGVGHTYLHVFPGRAMWRGATALDKLVHDPANRGFQAKPETFYAAHSIPIGFDFDPNILYYASNLGRDTMGLYALNLKSGARTDFAVESLDFDVVDPSLAGAPTGPDVSVDPLVFDRHLRKLVGVRLAGPAPSTRWLDSGLGQIQSQLDQEFPDRRVELLQWDDARMRFLALVTGKTDPGRFYVYTPAGDQLVLCARRAPWIASAYVCRASALAVTTGDGAALTGSLTEARNSRIQPPPLVVLCPDGPGQPPAPEFDRDAQAFAEMGYAVLRVNYRGTGGLGLKYLGAIRSGIDRVPLGDIIAAIQAISAQTPIDPKRIAVVGEGFGGYLALRAVQVHPEIFRCAVAISAPVDLGQWVREPDVIANTRARANDSAALQTLISEQNAGNPLRTLDPLHATVNEPPPTPPNEDSPQLYLAKARLAFFGNDRKAFAAISPARSPEDLDRPILLVEDETADLAYLESAKSLRSAIERHGGQADLLTVHGRLADMDATGHAKVLTQIESFLNLDFYTYNVEIGKLKTKD